MKTLLRIDSSLFSEQGVSHQLADELIEVLSQQHPDLSVMGRNLADENIPHLDGEWITALSTPEESRTNEQQKKSAYSDQLIAELQQSDAVVIGAPMYNFSVPSVLKAWFDHIARAGVTFSYTPDGPKGLLENKIAYVITTRGGLHKDKPSDTQVPFIRTILGFIGIDDVRFIYAEGLNMGNGARDQGLAEARQNIKQLVTA